MLKQLLCACALVCACSGVMAVGHGNGLTVAELEEVRNEIYGKGDLMPEADVNCIYGKGDAIFTPESVEKDCVHGKGD